MRDSRTNTRLGLYVLLAAWLAGGNVAVALSNREPPGRQRGQVKLSIAAVSPYQPLEGKLCRLEKRLFADAADGKLDEHSLAAAALVASGVDDPCALERYEDQLDGLVAELRRSGAVAGSPRERARVVFEFMHRRILRTGYERDCSNLTAALDEGRFNCVSASVLFVCLSGRFGLNARGLEVPGHAMCRLVLPGRTLDVETTCPRWFELIDRPRKLAELIEKTTGFHHLADRSPGQYREVSGIELVATIYYNRGVDLLARKRFARALAANAKALRLDASNPTALGNLLATLNNWAIDRGNLSRYAEAVGLLRQGLALRPNYSVLTQNYVHVHRQWVEHLCRARRFDEALQVLARAAKERPGEAYFKQARFDVSRRKTDPAPRTGRQKRGS